MADDKRIYELVDEQVTYSPGIFLQVDDSSFLSGTKKIAIGTIYPKTNTLDAAGDFNPTTTLVRLDNGSGDESKATVNAFLTDSDVVTTLLTALGLVDVAWANATRISGSVDSGSFNVKAGQWGKIVTIQGEIKLNFDPGTGVTVFNYPSSFGIPTVDIHFSSGDAQNGDNTEWFIKANTRNIEVTNFSTGNIQAFCVTFPAI